MEALIETPTPVKLKNSLIETPTTTSHLGSPPTNNEKRRESRQSKNL
jgi:hypothetical protein